MKVDIAIQDIKDINLNIDDLNVTKKEYKNILKTLNCKISDKITNKKLSKKIQKVLSNNGEYLLLLKNLANIIKIQINNNSSENHKINLIYKDQQKQKQQIIHVLMDLKLTNIALKQNISSKDLNTFRKLNKLKVNDLRKLSKLRNIKDSSHLSKVELIYNLFLTKKSLNEDRYMKIIKNSHDSRNKIMDRVNIARFELNKLHGYFTGEEKDDISKELNKIETRVLSSKKLP